MAFAYNTVILPEIQVSQSSLNSQIHMPSSLVHLCAAHMQNKPLHAQPPQVHLVLIHRPC